MVHATETLESIDEDGVEGVAHGPTIQSAVLASGDGVHLRGNDGEYDKTTGAITQTHACTVALIAIELQAVVDLEYARPLSPRAHGQKIHLFPNNRTVLSMLRAHEKYNSRSGAEETVQNAQQRLRISTSDDDNHDIMTSQ